MAKSPTPSAQQAALLNFLSESPANHIHNIATVLNMYFVRHVPSETPDISSKEADAICQLLELTCYLAEIAE